MNPCYNEINYPVPMHFNIFGFHCTSSWLVAVALQYGEVIYLIFVQYPNPFLPHTFKMYIDRQGGEVINLIHGKILFSIPTTSLFPSPPPPPPPHTHMTCTSNLMNTDSLLVSVAWQVGEVVYTCTLYLFHAPTPSPHMF